MHESREKDIEAFQSCLNVSRETLSALLEYETMLLKWNKSINLISNTTSDKIWTRHFLDSAQIIPLLPHAGSKIIDIGTGAGFPGLVLSIVAKEKIPSLEFTLVDESAKRAAFLREAVRVTGAKAIVINSKIETLGAEGFDIVTARAFAPLEKLLSLAHPHLTSDGRLLLLKGEESEKELEMARKKWSFKHESFTSQTNPKGVILRISELSSDK